jgi:hypothetical protein
LRRTPIVLTALCAGLAAGFLAWLAAGGSTAAATRLGRVEEQVSHLRVPRPFAPAPQPLDTTELAADPIFQLTTGPNPVPPPVLRLDGLVRSRGRVAGLLAINDKPAEWMTLGETRDGVTLLAVANSKVVADTVYGPVDVGLGQRPPTEASPPPPEAPAVAQNRSDAVPPGFRQPAPPASAPRRP